MRQKKHSKQPTINAKAVRESEHENWKHPGGKLLQTGPENLSDAELLSILIATGIKGKSAERIAEEIMERFGSFKGLANQPLEKLETLKGLGPGRLSS
jgi:DNA repair protein RadC